MLEDAARYAERGLADGELNKFGVLFCDFLTEGPQRAGRDATQPARPAAAATRSGCLGTVRLSSVPDYAYVW